MKRLLLTLAVLSPVLPVAAAEKPEAVIAQFDAERFQAMQKADVASLERLLAPDLSYTHSSGKVDTKASFVEAVKSGSLRYASIEAPQDVKVQSYGEAAVVTGQSRMTVVNAGQEMKVHLRFTDVWVKRAGRWQMVAWQSTKLPEP